ncbi:hypothetical protein BTM370_12620 [Helicobacter pylori]
MKLPKALNEATAGAALKYHIKRALERSHSISDFSRNLELSAQNAKFTNNTLKIIEELNNGVKQASEEIKEAAKPSNLVKSIREQDTRHFEVIEAKDKEAFFKDLNKNLEANATPLPKGMSVEEFKQTLESVENKDRFLEHLGTRDNSDERLAALDLVEPILREPHIEIFIKDNTTDKKEYIKAFKDENEARLYMLITQDNDTILRTFIPKLNERYMRNHVRNADIIHSFIQPNRTAKSDNALSDVVVYGENPTQKPLLDQEELLKTQENLNETTQEAKNLSPLEQAQAEKLAKLEHAITPLKEFGKNYPEFALKPKEALEKLLQEKNGQVAGAALKYHIKRALERSHSISDFSRNLELSAQNAKFTNNTLKIIEELNNGVKQASEEIKEKARDFSNEKLTNEQIRDLLNNAEIPTSGRDAITFGTNNLTPEIVEFLHKNNKKMIIEKASNKELELLADANFRHPENIRASLDHDAIAHILKRHGVNSVNVRNGEIPITNEDIANYRYIVNNADAILRTLDNENKELISAFKQINGYAVVVEQAINKKNELVLKTMYKSNGDYKDNNAYKKFSSTHTLNADAKVNHRLSSYSGATENPTQKPLLDQEELLKTQENLNETTQEAKNLSPLEQANAEKLAKLESEKLESEKEFTRLKEQEQARKAALKKKLEHERGNAGNIESQTKIEVGEDIPTHTQAQIPKSRVRLNEREIYDLNYAIVKSQDLKPSFTTGGTQKRTDMNEEQIKSIAENFDPKKIFGSGGFEDLPIILHDGQVIAGNHRVQGMLNFTPKSRFAYERAIKEYYHIDLKPDELLVRVPSKRLNNTEINNLAASSNQGRFNSESDHAIAVLSHYEPKLKELETKLNADSIYSLKNMVAKNLNFDKATHPNVGDSNLALLMFNMPRTKTQGIELLNRWQKEFSNDIKSYEKVKKMFVDNAGSFHNLIHDMSFPNVSLNAYLSDIMDRSFANLKNYQTTSESLKDLSEKFYKTSSLEMFEKSDQNTSDISEILGGAIARFARFDDPSKALFEALKSENIKKGLKEFKIADVTKDMFNPNSKEFKDIDIYDFTHYLLMVNREPNENNPTLKRLIEAVKDMQKENEKTIKEVSKTSAEKTEKRIKRDYSDTSLSNDESKSAY